MGDIHERRGRFALSLRRMSKRDDKRRDVVRALHRAGLHDLADDVEDGDVTPAGAVRQLKRSDAPAELVTKLEAITAQPDDDPPEPKPEPKPDPAPPAPAPDDPPGDDPPDDPPPDDPPPDDPPDSPPSDEPNPPKPRGPEPIEQHPWFKPRGRRKE